MCKRRGFTLIELLVVIAIIALLMGVLMPALARVRTQAKTAGCLMHLRQWGTIFTMYANDYESRFPTWLYIPVNYMENGELKNGQQDWVQYMKPYYMGEPKIRFCPAAKKVKNPTGLGGNSIDFQPDSDNDGEEKYQTMAWGKITNLTTSPPGSM